MSSSPPTLLKTEIDSRDSHGGQARIKAARFPARKTLEEFDFAFQTSLRRDTVLHLGQLDFLAGQRERRPARPARAPARRTSRSLWRSAPACRPARRLPHRDRVGRAARRRPTPRPPRHRARQAPTRPAADRRRGRLHPLRPPGREPDVHARHPPLRTRQPDRHQQQAVLALGRDLRRRGHRHRDDRPARPPRRDPQRSRATATASKTATSPAPQPTPTD